MSIFASPYTDAFCVQAARLIFDALPRAYDDPADLAARTDMANAATLAGLAFSNAFVGTNHALAHAVGARFGIAARPGQRDLPAARAALQRVPAEQVHAGAGLLGVRRAGEVRPARPGGVRRPRRPRRAGAGCSRGSRTCSTGWGCRARCEEVGVPEDEFEAALPELAMTAFQDLSNRTNPRMPLVSEITDLLRVGYDGR